MSRKGKFVPVMLTPFDANGSIDYDCLAKLTHYYIEAGATGLFANCLSSEMFELTEKERVEITAFVVREAAATVPVFSTGTFGGTIEQQAEFSKRIYDTGVAAVVAITSLLAEEHETNEVLTSNIHRLLKLTGEIPFGFYECPVPYKRILSPAMLQQIVSTERIVYYKDTSLDINAVKEKIRLTSVYPAFELYDAYMVNAVASLRAGCAGLSCIQGNYVPELISWIADNFSNPAMEKQVDQAQEFLNDTMDVMHDVYPVSAKYFLQSRNFPILLNTRRSVGVLSDGAKKSIDQLSDSYDRIQEELGIKTFIV